MANDHYSGFIKEAFISPIRSVLIIDDDYPTFDEILQNGIKKKSGTKITEDKTWHTNPERIKKVIDQFRNLKPPLLVDIHDGNNVTIGEEVKVAAHLHQSDLLVLDYQLDKAKPGDGAQAIKILRALMSNDHFNLVVVHTTESLDVVFGDVLVGLLNLTSIAISDEENTKATNLIASAEDEISGINERLFESLGLDQYLEFRRTQPKVPKAVSTGAGLFAGFKAICDEAKWKNGDPSLIFKYVANRRLKKLASFHNSGSQKEVSWSTGKVKWIRSSSIFVAFSQKSESKDLVAELHKALNNWGPPPSRLFLAKIRAEMDEFGVVAQEKALGNKFALVHWYNGLLNAKKPGRRWQVSESVSRHSEQLMDAVLSRVDNFAERLILADHRTGTSIDICKKYFEIDLSKEVEKKRAQRDHNSFVCSKGPTGWHLTTGHIFLLGQDHWVCLSPSCDMIPGQMSADRLGTLGNRIPFIAVKLFPVSDSTALADASSNRYIFIQLNEEVKCFKFNENENSAPRWYKLYADNLGKFKGQSFELKIIRTEKGSKKLVTKRQTAKVVSQLRYEYSLNLMHKLGASMTRVGLDFEG